ncbi:MAG: flagellin [Campylobacterota bacterium]
MTVNSMDTNSFNVNINQNKNNVDKVLDKLAALHEVNNESPADMIQHNKMQQDMLTASQEMQNANESTAMMQIQDSGLQQLKEGSQQLNELSTQRNSAALNADQKSMLDAQARGIKESMDHTIEQTSYNGQQMLSGIDTSSLDISDQGSIESFSSMLDDRLSDVGASMNAMESRHDQQATMMENLAASMQNKETDVAQAVNDLSSNGAKLDASLFASAHQNDFLATQVGRLLG